MKRLFSSSLLLLLLLLLSGCQSSTATLPQPGESVEETLGILEEAYRFSSSTREIVYNYAFALTDQGELERALEVTDQYLAQSPDELRFLTLRLYLLRSLEQYDDYLAALDYILTLDPANHTVRLERAGYYRNIGLEDEAVKDAMTILTYDIGNEEALDFLAISNDFYAHLANSSETGKAEEEEKKGEYSLSDFDFQTNSEAIMEMPLPQSDGGGTITPVVIEDQTTVPDW